MEKADLDDFHAAKNEARGAQDDIESLRVAPAEEQRERDRYREPRREEHDMQRAPRFRRLREFRRDRSKQLNKKSFHWVLL